MSYSLLALALVVGAGGDSSPCPQGTRFKAVEISKAYRDNQVYAALHFEQKELQVSGRIVSLKKVVRTDDAGEEVDRYFVALVTPDGKAPNVLGDGKPPQGVPLEFRFRGELTDVELCALAEIFPSKFVTFTGKCIGRLVDDATGYAAVVFENSHLVP